MSIVESKCLYCDVYYFPSENHVQENHLVNQFVCLICTDEPPKHFSFVTDASMHLTGDHGIILPSLADGPKLDVWLRLPEDLRMLECRLCAKGNTPTIYLARNRRRLGWHLAGNKHRLHVPLHVLQYKCRLCLIDFPSTKLFEQHPCLLSIQKSDSSRQLFDSDTVRCLYCNREVPFANRIVHRSKHSNLDFHCEVGQCTRSFVTLEDVEKHLEQNHNVEMEELSSVTATGLALSEKGLISLPGDLRRLQCGFCLQVFLCQHELEVERHMKNHNLSTAAGVKYSCRSCKDAEFESKEDFESHPCVSKTTRETLETDRGMKRTLDFDSKWPAVDDFVDGDDMRRLKCKFCGEEFNRCGFYVMLKHLEESHRKFPISHSFVMEKFALLGCAKCGNRFRANDVHSWSRHFTNADFTDCVGVVVVGGGDSNVVKTEENRVDDDSCNVKDIRMMKCLVCQSEFNHQGDVRQAEDDKLWMGCAVCLEECDAEKVRCFDESLTKTPVANHPDLRKLECLLCDFRSEETFDMLRHLAEDHDRHGERHVKFGCVNCPNFQAESAQLWDRHFGKSFGSCQGDSLVTPLRGGPPSFWCDTCLETRQNIDEHFGGECHSLNVNRFVESTDGIVLICNECGIKFTTQSNYNLHVKLPRHLANVSDR